MPKRKKPEKAVKKDKAEKKEKPPKAAKATKPAKAAKEIKPVKKAKVEEEPYPIKDKKVDNSALDQLKKVDINFDS